MSITNVLTGAIEEALAAPSALEAADAHLRVRGSWYAASDAGEATPEDRVLWGRLLDITSARWEAEPRQPVTPLVILGSAAPRRNRIVD